MSRVGKKPVVLPDKVKASLTDGNLAVTGPVGNLKLTLHPSISVEVGAKELLVKRSSDEFKAMHGLYRSLIQNMVTGVAHGYTKILDIVGVGYKAEVKGKNCEFALGYSHPIIFPIPEGLKVTVDKGTRVTITGADKKVVGETAARIRLFRKPEPYQGKGVRYSDEVVRRKVGKAAAVGGAAK